jgi:hypothetical protein
VEAESRVFETLVPAKAFTCQNSWGRSKSCKHVNDEQAHL